MFNSINICMKKCLTITIQDTSICSLKTVSFPATMIAYIHLQLANNSTNGQSQLCCTPKMWFCQCSFQALKQYVAH